MSRRRALLVGLVLASVAKGALAAPPTATKKPGAPPDIEAVEQLFAKLDYDKANDAADRLVKGRDVPHDILVRAYRVLAATDAILDKDALAREAFLTLLVIDPDYTVDPNLGPKVSTPFVEARGQFRSFPARPGLEVVATPRANGGQIRVKTRDPTHIAKRVQVGYRWASSGDYVLADAAVGEATVEVNAPPPGRTRLDFYARALDERDNELFEAGTAQLPKSAFAEAGAQTPPPATTTQPPKKEKPASGSPKLFENPIFWAGAGAGVLAVGAVLVLVFTSGDSATKGSLSPILRCGNDVCR